MAMAATGMMAMARFSTGLLRLEISSSNFPRLGRNLNTGGDNARDAEYVCADQTVFHDALRPSHLVLPVVRSDGA